ncbi:hypothetical protein [Tunturiibacter gelidoferens]|jgi:hypothetical protein|uniref:Uncharacterized protein n=1 Tax=Tunturiibacter gelidiferens TaxID=3069689 RepID=A0A9X0QE04_9BACT|nr:hypothetical protein [Edaphobacter lichenicola]MBB5328661.1 hypothetical protein [Edaphobacter lichenicola]
MSSLTARRTARRLLKVASLGLAGLLAGLLSGCNATPDSTNISTTTYTWSTHLPKSLDSVQVPPLRHAPSTRRLQTGSYHNVSQSMGPMGRNPS